MIKQLFPTLIFEKLITDPVLSLVQEQMDTALSNEKFIKITELEHPRIGNFFGTGGIINLDNNFIEDNNLYIFKNVITESVLEYFKEVKTPSKVIIKDSWVTKFLPGDTAQVHDHRSDVLSGVYYIKATGNEGNLRLINPLTYDKFVVDLNFEITPITGKLILFPGWLKHQVLQNNSNNERISLAFNLELFNEQ
jgi:uncharacterized protein (TIGR02466 family)